MKLVLIAIFALLGVSAAEAQEVDVPGVVHFHGPVGEHRHHGWERGYHRGWDRDRWEPRHGYWKHRYHHHWDDDED
jgi:hypothetical protein